MKLKLILFIGILVQQLQAQNQTFNFTATNQTINIGSTDLTGTWTAEMWVMRKANIPSSPGASVLLAGSTGKINLETWGASYKVGITYKQKYDRAFNYIVPLNQWVHLAFVYNGNYTFLLVNGVKKDSIYHTMTLPSIPMPMTTIGLNGESPNAYVDEIRLWNYARSTKEIFENYKSSVEPTHPNLIGYWYADDNATVATDLSTYSRTCAITGVTYAANSNTNFTTNIPFLAYKETILSHNNTSLVSPGSVTQEALLINVRTSGALNPKNISTIVCNAVGTSNLSEIRNAKLFYTGTNKIFSTASMFGTAQLISNQIKFIGNQQLKPGNNYFWLCYDVTATAQEGNVIDGQCESVVVDGTTYQLSNFAAEGARIIRNALPNSPNAISIVPKPQTIVHKKGSFTLNANARIVASIAAENEANQVVNFLRKPTMYSLNIVNSGAKAGDIIFRLDPTSGTIKKEGYELNVYTDSISIVASSNAGLYYGWQTLRQLFPKDIESRKAVLNRTWTIPCIEIKDFPRFSYRGFMFDPARWFHSAYFTKKLIDHLAMQKINYLHWHLVDDQGFRFECAKYPTLNSIGSWQKNCGNRGGYYSKAEMKEIVKYAQDRHIEIIPELEIPGHSQEMLASLPILKCTSAPATVDVSCSYGVITPNIMCGGQDTTYRIMENILLEYMDIFPSKYIHIGGDEAPKNNWDACTKCSAMKTKLGLSSSHYLQAHMTMHFNTFLKKYGKRIIGWEEILDGLTSTEPIGQQWNNAGLCYSALSKGNNVIFSDAGYYYLDMQQAAGEANSGFGYSWKGVNDLKDAYYYDPVLPTLTPTEVNRVLGLEACMWGETTVDTIHVEYMLYPRLFAVAEGMWSAKTKNYSDFYMRAANRIAVVDSMGMYHRQFSKDIAPAFEVTIDTVELNKTVEIKAKEISDFYYWSDAAHTNNQYLTVDKPGIYSVFYKIGNISIENKYIVKSPSSTKVESLTKKDFIYPNPAQNLLHFSTSCYYAKSLEILDVNGRKMLDKNTNAIKTLDSVNISGWPTGVYFLKLNYANNTSITQQFIKK